VIEHLSKLPELITQFSASLSAKRGGVYALKTAYRCKTPVSIRCNGEVSLRGTVVDFYLSENEWECCVRIQNDDNTSTILILSPDLHHRVSHSNRSTRHPLAAEHFIEFLTHPVTRIDSSKLSVH